MIYLTRRERFAAAHRMFREEWSDEKNKEVFGQCSNPNWHGHNYHLFITVKGEINPETGFVVNLKDLSRVVKSVIIDKVDHKNLNLEVDFLKGVILSSENIVKGIWDELTPHIEKIGARLHKIRLIETENNIIEYYG